MSLSWPEGAQALGVSFSECSQGFGPRRWVVNSSVHSSIPSCNKHGLRAARYTSEKLKLYVQSKLQFLNFSLVWPWQAALLLVSWSLWVSLTTRWGVGKCLLQSWEICWDNICFRQLLPPHAALKHRKIQRLKAVNHSCSRVWASAGCHWIETALSWVWLCSAGRMQVCAPSSSFPWLRGVPRAASQQSAFTGKHWKVQGEGHEVRDEELGTMMQSSTPYTS